MYRMNVFGINIPDKSLTNFDLLEYVEELKIPHFRGVFMRDTIPKVPNKEECGIVNFNTSQQPGSHWVCYYKHYKYRIYFDSYGQVMLGELRNYLKSKYEGNKEVIQQNTDIVQPFNSMICGHLCLFVLKALNKGWSFREILDTLILQNMQVQKIKVQDLAIKDIADSEGGSFGFWY